MGDVHTLPDSGRGWAVVVASFMMHAFVDGAIFSFGVFHHELVEYFHASEGTTSLISSILVSFSLCTGPVSSALVNRYGCRRVAALGGIVGALGFSISALATNITTLQITIGVISGTGLGMLYPPATVAVLSHFERRRGLATGLASCGSGLGTFLAAPTARWLLAEYGWRGSLALLGGLILHSVPCSLLFNPLPPRPNQESFDNKKLLLANGNNNEQLKDPTVPSGQLQGVDESLTLRISPKRNEYLDSGISENNKQSQLKTIDLSLLKNPLFQVLAASNFCTSLGIIVPFVYIVSYAEKHGITKTKASFLLSAIGIANTSGRIILGYLFDKKYIDRQKGYNCCLIIGGICIGMSSLCRTFESLIVFALIFGFTFGAYAGLTSVIAADLFGIERLADVFGFLLLFQGFANFLGPPITGWLYDWRKSYVPGFMASGCAMCISGMILFTIPLFKKKHLAIPNTEKSITN